MRRALWCAVVSLVTGAAGFLVTEANGGVATNVSWILWTVAIVSACCVVILVSNKQH